MCILALNIIIDKIYLVLWFWFVFVAVVGAVRVLLRILQVISNEVSHRGTIMYEVYIFLI